MSDREKDLIIKDPGALFERVVSILEQARSRVVRSVNANMVQAYWLIGREIVQEIQGGEERAKYGSQVLESLSKALTERYGRGFSTTNLKYFRLFYQAYPDRISTIRHPTGDESGAGRKDHSGGGQIVLSRKTYPTGTKLSDSFDPQLSRSHYRAPMRVEDPVGWKTRPPDGSQIEPIQIIHRRP